MQRGTGSTSAWGGGSEMKTTVFLLLLVLTGAVAADERPSRFFLRAERFSFMPSQIKVAADKPVELVVTSEDTQHGFWIRKLGINHIIPARGKGELKLTLPPLKPGTYIFECSRACGAGHNMMRGRIKVE